MSTPFKKLDMASEDASWLVPKLIKFQSEDARFSYYDVSDLAEALGPDNADRAAFLDALLQSTSSKESGHNAHRRVDKAESAVW